MNPTPTDAALPSSFRDPSGFVFEREGRLYRSVSGCYAGDYARLTSSGLYDALVREGKLVAHREVELTAPPPSSHLVLEPDRLPFVSYPYEWCFSQLQDAARLSLDVAEAALSHEMVLKDASAFNVQFRGCRPVFADTLSFESYRAGEPWVAYRQFCRHFLGPLAVMAYRDVRLSGLWRGDLEGLPLDLASRLLPRRTWLRPGLAMHLHLHALGEAALTAAEAAGSRRASVSRGGLRALLDSLRRTVSRLRSRLPRSLWDDYERINSYDDAAREHKERLVRQALDLVTPRLVFDLGANVGRFGRLAAGLGADAICLDADPAVIEQAYRHLRSESADRVLPLVMNLANPSPSLGWAHAERSSLTDRGPADVALALALVHHLAIGANVPLSLQSAWLAKLAKRVVVEWVPKTDPQVKSLLAGRRDVFADYGQEGFEAAFGERWRLVSREGIVGTERSIYVWERPS